MESDKLKEICSHFEIDTKIEPYGNGHINDTYFKIHRENHNLIRCRTQLKLVADIEKKLDKMSKYL